MLTICTQHVLTTVLVYKYTFVDNLLIFVFISAECFLFLFFVDNKYYDRAFVTV